MEKENVIFNAIGSKNGIMLVIDKHTFDLGLPESVSLSFPFVILKYKGREKGLAFDCQKALSLTGVDFPCVVSIYCKTTDTTESKVYQL